MKKFIKISALIVIALFLLFRLSLWIFRMPSYNIQMEGKLYVVSKRSEDVRVIDLNSGEALAETPIDILSHEAVSTFDGNRVVVTNTLGGEGNLVKVINTSNNKIETSIDIEGDKRVSGIVALREPNKVAVIDLVNNDLLVIDVKTGTIEKQISTEQEKSHLLVLHPTEDLAYVTNVASGSVSVINLNTEKVVKIIPCTVGRKGIEITPDGSELWVTNTKDNTITIIDTKTNTVTDVLTSGNEAMKLKFSVDGKYCFVLNANDGNIYVFDQASKKNIKTITLHGKDSLIEKVLYHTPRPVNVLMHPNGLYAFIANSNANKIEVVDMKTFDIVSTIGTGWVPDALAYIQ